METMPFAQGTLTGHPLSRSSPRESGLPREVGTTADSPQEAVTIC
jgi:hypothetical protein